MSDFASSWTLSRSRFIETLQGLTPAQLNWQLHPQALSIGQMALHVAGVETLFATQLGDISADAETARLKSAATDGVINENAFPFAPEEISFDTIQAAMERSRGLVEPLINDASEEIRVKQIVSALGPVISGEGAFARLGFHAAYHQGQAYLVRTSPGFPGN